MFDTATARRLMVEGQIRTADVTETELLEAMLTVPRERFVPPPFTELAYIEKDIPIGDGRTILKPMVLAKLIQAARVRGRDRVLDLACGTGYSTAILARLAGTVIALEEDPALASKAKTALAAVDVGHAEVVVGPHVNGWAAGAPYDVILLNGAAEVLPEVLARQLAADGRLLCVYGRAPATKGTIFHVSDGELVGRPLFDASATLLPGFAKPPTFVF